MGNSLNHPTEGKNVRIRMVQHFHEWRPGEIYTVEDWVGKQLAEAGKALIIKDINPLDGTVKRGPGRPRKYPVIDGISA